MSTATAKTKKTTTRKAGEKLDAATKARRAVLDEMRKMTSEELFGLAVRAGIYTKRGKLTRPYRDDSAPSASRPTD
jgi:hypothetical protein